MNASAGRMLGVVFVSLLLSGCARPTEVQRLAKLRQSSTYKAYCYGSSRAVALASEEYNKKGGAPVTEGTLHATLGLLWFLAQKPELALMEAELAAAGSARDGQLFGLGVQATALTAMNCPEQARQCYEELQRARGELETAATNRMDLGRQAMFLGLVAAGLCCGDAGLAGFGADALGTNPQLGYVPPLVGAVCAAQQGDVRQGLDQLKQVSQNERFHAQAQALLGEVSNLMTKDAGAFGAEQVRQVLSSTVKVALEDVFRGAESGALLARIREWVARSPGGPVRDARGRGDASAETASLPPVVLSEELRSQGVVFRSLRYSHGIHGDPTLMARVTLDAKTSLVAFLELAACDSASNVIKKSMLCLRPTAREPAYTFMLSKMLNASYAPSESIAYYTLSVVPEDTPVKMP